MNCKIYPLSVAVLAIFLVTFLHNQPASLCPVRTASIWTWFSNAEDGGSTFLQNTGVNLWSYTVSKSRSQSPWRWRQHVPL